MRSSFLRAALAASIFLFCLVSGAVFVRLSLQKDVFHFVCSMVQERFFQPGPELDDWSKRCHLKASHVPLFISLNQLFDQIRLHLDELGISHLNVYDPVDDDLLWKGRAVYTGIRPYMIDGYTVVAEVLPESAASLHGIQKGDIIEAINQKPVQSRWQVQTSAGVFHIRRGQEKFTVEIEPTTLLIDEKPRVYKLGEGTGVLKIPSFRGDFFPRKNWVQLVRQLSEYEHVVVDVRNNSGGNFVAMLRGLSPFFCEPTEIGRLTQPQKADIKKQTELSDNIADSIQLEVLASAKEIVLKTFPNYGCFKGKVTVLMDQSTASAAEIFSQAFLERDQARVWGAPTMGDVVLAVWYEIPQLGEGYSLSIPEAIYLSPSGESLERRGVWPERELYYMIEDALAGRDSWLKESRSLKSFSQ